LPVSRMPIARFKRARVNIDYHVELDGHFYSVPHRLVRAEVELRIAGATVEILAGQQRVAAHALSAVKGAHTTVAEHMPASHRAHLEWTPAKLIAWGERIGAVWRVNLPEGRATIWMRTVSRRGDDARHLFVAGAI